MSPVELDPTKVSRQIVGQNDAIARIPHVSARDFFLQKGTDKRFGARHLKRAIERLVVQPMFRRIGTRQVS